MKPQRNSNPALTKGEGDGDPLQHSCLGNPADRGARQVIVRGIEGSRT